MEHQLHHSHIAVRIPLTEIVRALDSDIERAEDDLGPYTYTDIRLVGENRKPLQLMRYAQRSGDKLSHLMAENPDATSQLAFVLYLAGVKNADQLSISTDQYGKQVRSLHELLNLIKRESASGEISNELHGKTAG